jgi:hypothetical protein
MSLQLRGRPRRRPRQLFADRGYDYDGYRQRLRARRLGLLQLACGLICHRQLIKSF